MAALHGLIAERAAQMAIPDGVVAMSICEVFMNPPADLSPDGSPIAWHCIITGDEVVFEPFASEAAAYQIEGEYDAILPLGRFDTRGDPERAATLRGMSQAAIDQGLMRIRGQRVSGEIVVPSVHDAIARLTV